jgi:hypothetical protein
MKLPRMERFVRILKGIEEKRCGHSKYAFFMKGKYRPKQGIVPVAFNPNYTFKKRKFKKAA